MLPPDLCICSSAILSTCSIPTGQTTYLQTEHQCPGTNGENLDSFIEINLAQTTKNPGGQQLFKDSVSIVTSGIFAAATCLTCVVHYRVNLLYICPVQEFNSQLGTGRQTAILHLASKARWLEALAHNQNNVMIRQM